MSIFSSIFSPAAPAAPTQAAPVVPQTGSGAVPDQPNTPPGQMPGTKQEPVNPMDAYTKVFDNATKAQPDVAPSFNLDPKVLGEASSSLNFTQGIPQDLMTKALAGDAKAMMDVINASGQNAYKAAMSHSSALTDQFVAKRAEFDLKSVAGKVNNQLTHSALADSPNYSHPVVKQEFTRVANALQAAHPDASPADIAKATKDYMQDLHNAMNPNSTPAGKAAEQKAAGTDWEQYFTS